MLAGRDLELAPTYVYVGENRERNGGTDMRMRLLAATLIGAATLFGSAVGAAGQPGPAWEQCIAPPDSEEYCLTVTYTPPNTLTVVWDDVSDDPWWASDGFELTHYQVTIEIYGRLTVSDTYRLGKTATTFSYEIDWEAVGFEPGTRVNTWVTVEAFDDDRRGTNWGVVFVLRRPDDEPQAPTTPMGLALTAGDGSLLSTWTAPVNDGGSPITGYRVQWRSGND